MLNQDVIEKIKQKSISLERYGLNDLAWKKEDAIELIYSIMQDQIGILGGDVYKLTAAQLESVYHNWSSKRAEQESYQAFYLRSKAEALGYIEQYSIHPEEGIVFSITFTKQIG